MSDYLKYQQSISNEIISTKDRIRDLIGGIHYGEDGRYKEFLLRNIIMSKLPSFAAMGTGFVLGETEISTQIDIIIFRKDFPLIFQCSDFVIVPKEAVLGIIEVKTRLNPGNFRETYLILVPNKKMTSDSLDAIMVKGDDYDEEIRDRERKNRRAPKCTEE